MREHRFVRFTRIFEQGFARGYILDVGPRFFLMALQGDEIRFDGFACFRFKDVRNLEIDPFAAFSEAALKKLKVPTPKKPEVVLGTIEDLMLSANRSFPVITIHREGVVPDACWIGRVEAISRGHVSLLEIAPNAKWDRRPTQHKLSAITAVEFGGEYERALVLVGGDMSTGKKGNRMMARKLVGMNRLRLQMRRIRAMETT